MADSRLKYSPDEARNSRAMEDRAITESRELTDEDRLMAFRNGLLQNVLPDLPHVDGYHVAWLSTTNGNDSLASRTRLGYQPLTPEDVPGWEFNSLKGSDIQGWPISCNEMVAAKIPVRLYNLFMKTVHHDAPMQEEEKLAEVAERIRAEAGKSVNLVVEEGFQRQSTHPAAGPRNWE